MSNTHFHCRKLKNKLMLTLSFLAVFFGLFWLCWILFTLITKGIPALSLELFLEKNTGTG